VRKITGKTLESASTNPGRSGILQLSMATDGAQQANDIFDTEIEYLGPAIKLSPIRIPSPRIIEFLQKRIHIDT
jgi:hypothetical protein